MTDGEKLAQAERMLLRQQVLISQLRAECRRLRTLRLRVATGELADQVDMEKELGKQKEFLPVANERYQETLELIRKAAKKDPDAAEALKRLEAT